MNITGYWEETKRQWKLPNALTFSRALLGIMLPLFWYLGPSWLLAAIIYAGISDGLDGWLARKLHSETTIGAIFDPLADKVFTDIFLLGLAFKETSIWFSILAVTVILYDIDNTYQRRHNISAAFSGRSSKLAKPVTWLSKTKTALLFVLMGMTVAHPDYLSIVFPYQALELLAVFCIALVLTLWFKNRRELFWW